MASRIDYSQNRKLYVGTTAEVTVADGNAIIDNKLIIGTTSSNFMLDVALSATVGSGSVSSSTTNSENMLVVAGKNNYSDGTTWFGDYGQILLDANSNMTGGAKKYLITNALDNNKFAIIRSDFNAIPTVNSTGNGVNIGTADFVIDNSGKVGIGASSPSYKLQVGGTAYIDSTLYVNGQATFDDQVNVTSGYSINFGTSRLHSTDTSYFVGGNVLVGATAINGAFGASNTVLAVKGKTSGGEGIIQITGLGNNATDNVGALMFYSQAEADAMCSIRSVRGNADDVGTMTFLTNNGGTESEKMRINSAGQVGIGTDSPDKTLTVGGTNTTHGIDIKTKIGSTVYKLWEAEQFFSDEGYQGIYYQNAKKIQFRSNGDSYLNGGNVGIGNTLPQYKLDVSGTIRVQNYRLAGNTANPTTTAATIYDQASVGLTFSAHNVSIRNYNGSAMVESARFTTASLTVIGDIIAYGSPSDIRLKENIKPIESALDKVMKLEGVTFDWKESDSILDIKEDIGFIAQDVQKIVPELVRENKDGMLSMRHQGIAPILLEAIKELKAEIEELKKQIK